MDVARRSFIVSSIGLVGFSGAPFVAASRPPKNRSLSKMKPTRKRHGPGSPYHGLLTASTATDAISRGVLEKPISTLYKGVTRGVDRDFWLQRRFSSIIDQNFAWLPAPRLARMLDSLSAQELSNLAQLYVNSAATTGHSAFALDIAASKLDVGRLGRLSGVFGFAPVYASVTRHAPQKANEFIAHSNPSFATPSPGMHRVQRNGRTAGHQLASPNILLDYTIDQIYLSFRTAPIGSLSVPAALYETGTLVFKNLSLAGSIGYGLGAFMVWGIQTIAPSYWDSIVDNLGGWINNLIENINAPPNPDIYPPLSPEENQNLAYADWQADSFDTTFELPYSDWENYGVDSGDYGVTSEWAHFESGGYGGGGAGCRLLDEGEVNCN